MSFKWHVSTYPSRVELDYILERIEGDPDRTRFQYDFLLEGKADDGGIVTEQENGDLIIEGWAAVFDGVDRQNENFMPGAFQRGIKGFLNGQRSLCFHHKHDHILGEVVDLKEVEGKGLWMRARVDHQPESSPLRYLYNAVQKGTLKALSVGGYFKRAMTAAGRKIADMDFTEISITPVPVHAGTNFSVVAGKALEDPEPDPQPGVAGMERLMAAMAKLDTTIEQIEGKAVKGDPMSLHYLGRLLSLSQESASVADNASGSEDERVVALAKRVKNYLDSVGRDIHAIAAEIGPLPSAGY